MANTNIKITDLDFDTIKSTLKTYLSGQTVFTDYDFEGSAMSVLLDVLSYNTHYNAFYANMIANEMFLDSASQRDSVVSLAKHLGYTPQSASASSAEITVVLTESGTTSTRVTIPKYAKFESIVDGTTYTFYTMNSYSAINPTVVNSNNVFTIAQVALKEGVKLNKTFQVADSSQNAERYILPNENIDTSTLVVRVKDSEGTADSGYVTYTKNSGIKDLTSTDTIYFLNEVEDGKYEIFFGDGAYGKKLASGNVISIDYLTTKGKLANGAGSSEDLTSNTYGFSPISPTNDWGFTATGTAVSVSTVAKVSGTFGSVSTGGSDSESIDSIKFVAPINFQAQNRALTANDYKAIILANYTNVDSIRVWGGEDNSRPEYGKVFVVVKPKNGTTLTTQNISDIKDTLKKYKPMGIEVDVNSPEYLYLTITSIVKYNPNATIETSGTLKGLVIDSLKNYNNTNLATFDSIFRFSQISGVIDDSENSISSNSTSVGVRQHKNVLSSQLSEASDVYGDQTLYEYTFGKAIDVIFNDIDMKSKINTGTFTSDTFTTLGKVLTETNDTIKTVKYIDDGNGKINLVTSVDEHIVKENVGTINYITGLISTLTAVNIISITSDNKYLKFSADVVNQDIYPTDKQIILFEEADISVTMQSEVI